MAFKNMADYDTKCPYHDAPKPTFVMTDREILRNWRCSENKTAQVRIIAELNARSVRDTINKLRSLGIELDEHAEAAYYGIGEHRQRWTRKEIDLLIDMKENKKMLWKEIAFVLHRSVGSVQNKYLYAKRGGNKSCRG